MADQRVLRDSKPIPHVYGAENVEQYDCTQIGDMVRRLESAQTWRCLDEDSLAWRASSDLLGNVATRIKTLAGELSRSWRGEDAVASQSALQRLEATARHLSERAGSMRQFTEDSGRIVQNAVTNFPWHGPGGVLGEIKGWVQDNPWAGFLSGNVAGVVAILGYNRVEEEFGLLNGYYRDALAAFNEQYVEVNRTTLPYNVAVDLPRILPRQVIREDESLPGGGGGIGGGPGGAGGPRLPTTDLSPMPSLPPPSGFDSAAIGPQGLSDNPGGDGFGPGGPGPGGALGELPTGGLAGAGGPAGVGGLGPGGGAGMGGVGAGGGLGAGGTGAGIGGPGAAVGLGPGGMGPGGIGRGGTGRAGGGTGPGSPGRAGGGAGQSSGGAGGRPGGGGTGVGGRSGIGGGMVPMGGAGRGGGDEKPSRTSWLVEDDDPWRGDEDDLPPPVLR